MKQKQGETYTAWNTYMYLFDRICAIFSSLYLLTLKDVEKNYFKARFEVSEFLSEICPKWEKCIRKLTVRNKTSEIFRRKCIFFKNLVHKLSWYS